MARKVFPALVVVFVFLAVAPGPVGSDDVVTAPGPCKVQSAIRTPGGPGDGVSQMGSCTVNAIGPCGGQPDDCDVCGGGLYK